MHPHILPSSYLPSLLSSSLPPSLPLSLSSSLPSLPPFLPSLPPSFILPPSLPPCFSSFPSFLSSLPQPLPLLPSLSASPPFLCSVYGVEISATVLSARPRAGSKSDKYLCALCSDSKINFKHDKHKTHIMLSSKNHHRETDQMEGL